MRVIVPSRGRADTIGQKTLRLFPTATVCVDEAEEAAYRAVTDNLLLHPRLPSLAAIRQWILDNVDDECVVQVDDDVEAMLALTGMVNRPYTDPDDVAQVIENAYECAKAAGARLFGFNQSADVKAYHSWQPFRLNSWVGSVLGIIGRDLRYDRRFSLRDDFDLSLQSLLKHRIVWQDMRFHFASTLRFSNIGGNTVHRSHDREQREIALLKTKWGRYVRFSYRTGGASTSAVRVKRTW